MKKNCLTDSELIEGIEKKYRQLPESDKRVLTPEQEKEIKDFFFELTGKEDVPTNWHKFFYSRNGIYSKEYLPMTITRELVKRMNKCEYRNAYADKNMLDNILPNASHPKIILKNMNGYFYFNNKPVSHKEAIELCRDLGRVLIKPSLRSQGVGIREIDIKGGIMKYDGRNLSVSDLFSKYDKNFCIQEIIQQHEDMAKLNPSSVNTIRVLSYRSGMEVLILYTALRIGRKDKVVDNESSGGISVNILSSGELEKYAISGLKEGRLDKTDSGVVLEGYKVPCYDKAVELVKDQHLYLPFFNFVAWDIAIDKDGNPVIIEWNVYPGLSQSACGPALGKYTTRILSEVMPRKNK